ncbi:hypothetical protein BGX23_005211 [Mortierella sp. AD031]|nr:hypothetical protein BGX23_005211 [Mortierella sp. AD031]
MTPSNHSNNNNNNNNTGGGNSLLTHTQWIHLRQEAQLRRQTLATFGPQGVLDLALVGAILGNNIREIGRYSVTCDGSLVRGRYTIYELVHFGALAVTGRGRRRSSASKRRASDATSATVDTSSSSSTTSTATATTPVVRIYPTTLSNLFPAMVFKTMRRKSVRPPKFQHDDDDDNYSSMLSTPTISPMSAPKQQPTLAEATTKDCHPVRPHGPTLSVASSTTTANTATTTTAAEPMLITSEAVLSHLIQYRLHRVKDLPLPRELCFIGAVSLPLPPVLRAMHVAWTMDFLKALGGMEFRPDIYAHKMRLARLVRAQQQQKQQQEQKTAPSMSIANSPPSVPATTTTTSTDNKYGHHRLSASMLRGPSSVSIPEEDENDDEDQLVNAAEKVVVPPTPAIPLLLNEPTVPIPAPVPIPSPSTTTTTAAKKSVRQDKRLMQQLLSLENKVPRIVRQWANVARTCFEDELVQEDREVQIFVDRQRIQVVLGCGYRFGSSPPMAPLVSSTNTSNAAAVAVTTTGSTITATTTSRPRLSPIATALANSSVNATNFGHSQIQAQTQTRSHQHAPSVSSSPALRGCFPEGIRLGGNHLGGGAGAGQNQQQQHQNHRSQRTRSRPTSASMNERLSASQQMLSMHLWLSLLVSPLSPEHMIQDQFGFLDK